METDKILVLNIGPLEHLCTNLREILERSTDLKVKFEQRSLLETLSGGFECGQISNAIAHFRPRVIFLVWAGKNFEQVNAALASIRAESMDIPLFAVLDTDAPEEIMGLLQIGVEDFITPPLKLVDILPRLWRTLERTRPEDPLTQALKAKLGLQHHRPERCERSHHWGNRHGQGVERARRSLSQWALLPTVRPPQLWGDPAGTGGK